MDQAGLAYPTFTTLYRYDGATTHIELPGGLTAARTFDARGLLVDTVDTAGSITSYRHDAQGQVILIEDSAGNANGRASRFGYDSLGRMRMRVVDGVLDAE